MALFGLPDHLLVEQLAASVPEEPDDPSPMVEVMPESLRIEELQFLFFITQQIAQAPIVEQESSLFVNDEQRRGAILQDLTKLALLLGDLRLALGQRGDVVHPANTLATDEADMSAAVGHLHIRDEQVQKLPLFGLPDHLLVQQLAASVSQRFNNPSSLLEVVPERAGVNVIDLLLRVPQEFPQARVMEEQTAVLIDDYQGRRAEFEHLAELALLLGDLHFSCAAASRSALITLGRICCVSAHAKFPPQPTALKRAYHCWLTNL